MSLWSLNHLTWFGLKKCILIFNVMQKLHIPNRYTESQSGQERESNISGEKRSLGLRKKEIMGISSEQWATTPSSSPNNSNCGPISTKKCMVEFSKSYIKSQALQMKLELPQEIYPHIISKKNVEALINVHSGFF